MSSKLVCKTPNLIQLDGNDSILVSESENNPSVDNDTEPDLDTTDVTIATEDEFEPDTTPIAVTPKIKINDKKRKVIEAASLPLVTTNQITSKNL